MSLLPPAVGNYDDTMQLLLLRVNTFDVKEASVAIIGKRTG